MPHTFSTQKMILLSIVIAAITCLFMVFIFSLPAFANCFILDTQSKANLGSAIGGMTAPIIGLVSTSLLYLALNKQTESNIEQRLKNESDIIFLLFQQLDKEVSNFYWKVSHKKGNEEWDVIQTGHNGFITFCREYGYKIRVEAFSDIPGTSFRTWPPSAYIDIMVSSFNLIDKRIEISQLSPGLKQLFYTKLNSYYESWFLVPLSILADTFNHHPSQADSITKRIQELVTRQESNPSLAEAIRVQKMHLERKRKEKLSS